MFFPIVLLPFNFQSIMQYTYILHINNVKYIILNNILWGLPGGAVVENPPANAGETGSSPGPGRSHMPRSS